MPPSAKVAASVARGRPEGARVAEVAASVARRRPAEARVAEVAASVADRRPERSPRSAGGAAGRRSSAVPSRRGTLAEDRRDNLEALGASSSSSWSKPPEEAGSGPSEGTWPKTGNKEKKWKQETVDKSEWTCGKCNASNRYWRSKCYKCCHVGGAPKEATGAGPKERKRGKRSGKEHAGPIPASTAAARVDAL